MAFTALDAKRELARRAQEELATRRETPEFKADVIRQLRADLFQLQLDVLDCESDRIAVCCSRRAGKTELAGRMLAISLLESGHNETSLFAARTLARARQIIWPILDKINHEYGLGWTMSAHIGQITTPDGACFILLGVDDQNAAEKVRGSKWRLAVCDESATYEMLLERLVVDCISPGCIDVGGRIVLAGTPGYSRRGYWYSVSSGLKPGWKCFGWTLKDNPLLLANNRKCKSIEDILRKIREEENISEEDPSYRREYLGEWVQDESVLVYAANNTRNTARDLPDAPANIPLDQWIRESWLVTCALDVGFTDACAVVALGSPPGSTDVYVLDAFTQAGLRADEQALKLKEFRDKYRASRTVIDVGGQGKLVFAEFQQRYGKMAGGAAIPAKKMNRSEAIGMFNSDLRLGRVKAFVPSAAPVVEEWNALPWADEAKTKAHPAYPNHCSDATLYAWREHRAFLAKPAVVKTDADREADEIAAAKAQWRKGGRK
jgi:hypothetical protein